MFGIPTGDTTGAMRGAAETMLAAGQRLGLRKMDPAMCAADHQFTLPDRTRFGCPICAGIRTGAVGKRGPSSTHHPRAPVTLRPVGTPAPVAQGIEQPPPKR